MQQQPQQPQHQPLTPSLGQLQRVVRRLGFSRLAQQALQVIVKVKGQ